jgi:1-deoxy-D-xylulose-5-phosphate reductoisomerase
VTPERQTGRPDYPQGVTILGSTGSVGESTLDVIGRNPQRYRVSALTAHSNVERLAAQCVDFQVPLAVIADSRLASKLEKTLHEQGAHTEVMAGDEGLLVAAGMAESDILMAAIVGAAGLKPTLHAARNGKKILLANKESLVVAGELFLRAARLGASSVLPVDSEHNAIFQSLPDSFHHANSPSLLPDGHIHQPARLAEFGVEEIILTASGGPFLDLEQDQFAGITPEQACAHPNWDMGRKISVDSATLMNKGLEVIEARWLFNAGPDDLQVVIHPQSIIHSMVAYTDGSIIAQMGMPDMKTPIAHTLAWPDRIEAGVDRLNLCTMDDLSFREPDLKRFPCLQLAFDALAAGGNAAIVLNASNEIAVEAFLGKRIRFDQIPRLVDEVMQAVPQSEIAELEDILACDALSRETAERILKTYG